MSAWQAGLEDMEDGRRCVEVRGNFDGRAARWVVAMLQQELEAERVLLDFSRVGTLHDAALGLLVEGMRRMPGLRLETRGLTGHSVRLLRLLRVDPETLRPPATPALAETGGRSPRDEEAPAPAEGLALTG